MNCDDVRRHWNLFYDSEGTPDCFQQINQHLEECPECAAWYRRQEQLEAGIVSRVASGQPTPELWDAIVLTEGDAAKPTTSRKWLMWFAFAAVACLLIAAGLKFSGGTPEDNADELDLARLSTQWHRDLSEGTQQVGFRSSSDLDVERYLRRRVEFPVRCPPRKDTGFIVSGAGVCRFEGQKAAYLVGKLDGNDVSIFILSRDALRRFPRQHKDLEQGDALSCVDGVYRTTMAAIDRNVVLAVGNASCTRLVRVIRAYGTYPHGDDNSG